MDFIRPVAFDKRKFKRSINRTAPGVQTFIYSAARARANYCLAICIFLFFTVGAQLCHAQVPELLNAPKEQQAKRIREFMFGLSLKDSVSQSRSVDSIRQLSKKLGDERAELYAHLFFAEMKSRNGGQTIATVLLAEKKVFETTSLFDVKAIYYLVLGGTYERLGNNEEMFHYIIAATNIFETIGWSQAPIGWLDYLFHVYYRYQDYPNALRFVKIALNKSTPDNTGYDFRLNNMGETYLRLKDIASAQATFQQVIQRATALRDSVYIGIGSGNYGNTLRLQQRYREALPYLYLDMQLNEKKVPENSSITSAYIADCLLHCDSLEKALTYLQKAATLRDAGNWYSFLPPYYEASALYWKIRGDYRQVSLYQDSLIVINNRSREQFNSSLLLTTSLTIKEERRLAEQREKALEASQLRLIRDVIIVLLVLLFSAVLAGMIRKRQKERRSFAAQQLAGEKRLHDAETELGQYISALKEKNKLIEQIEGRLQRRADSPEGREEVNLQDLQHLSLLTEEDWLRFKVLFSGVWPGFFEGLPSRYPDLSQGEVRLLALCRLELSSKEMAAMLGISQDSLRKSRYRLRKKFPQLTEDEDFKNAI